MRKTCQQIIRLNDADLQATPDGEGQPASYRHRKAVLPRINSGGIRVESSAAHQYLNKRLEPMFSAQRQPRPGEVCVHRAAEAAPQVGEVVSPNIANEREPIFVIVSKRPAS